MFHVTSDVKFSCMLFFLNTPLNGYLSFPGPGSDPGRWPRPWSPVINLYLPTSALNLYFPAPTANLCLPAPTLNLFLPPNLCLPVLRFTVKICYSYSVYLYKLSVYLYVLAPKVKYGK